MILRLVGCILAVFFGVYISYFRPEWQNNISSLFDTSSKLQSNTLPLTTSIDSDSDSDSNSNNNGSVTLPTINEDLTYHITPILQSKSEQLNKFYKEHCSNIPTLTKDEDGRKKQQTQQNAFLTTSIEKYINYVTDESTADIARYISDIIHPIEFDNNNTTDINHHRYACNVMYYGVQFIDTTTHYLSSQRSTEDITDGIRQYYRENIHDGGGGNGDTGGSSGTNDTIDDNSQHPTKLSVFAPFSSSFDTFIHNQVIQLLSHLKIQSRNTVILPRTSILQNVYSYIMSQVHAHIIQKPTEVSIVTKLKLILDQSIKKYPSPSILVTTKTQQVSLSKDPQFLKFCNNISFTLSVHLYIHIINSSFGNNSVTIITDSQSRHISSFFMTVFSLKIPEETILTLKTKMKDPAELSSTSSSLSSTTNDLELDLKQKVAYFLPLFTPLENVSSSAKSAFQKSLSDKLGRRELRDIDHSLKEFKNKASKNKKETQGMQDMQDIAITLDPKILQKIVENESFEFMYLGVPASLPISLFMTLPEIQPEIQPETQKDTLDSTNGINTMDSFVTKNEYDILLASLFPLNSNIYDEFIATRWGNSMDQKRVINLRSMTTNTSLFMDSLFVDTKPGLHTSNYTLHDQTDTFPQNNFILQDKTQYYSSTLIPKHRNDTTISNHDKNDKNDKNSRHTQDIHPQDGQHTPLSSVFPFLSHVRVLNHLKFPTSSPSTLYLDNMELQNIENMEDVEDVEGVQSMEDIDASRTLHKNTTTVSHAKKVTFIYPDIDLSQNTLKLPRSSFFDEMRPEDRFNLLDPIIQIDLASNEASELLGLSGLWERYSHVGHVSPSIISRFLFSSDDITFLFQGLLKQDNIENGRNMTMTENANDVKIFRLRQKHEKYGYSIDYISPKAILQHLNMTSPNKDLLGNDGGYDDAVFECNGGEGEDVSMNFGTSISSPSRYCLPETASNNPALDGTYNVLIFSESMDKDMDENEMKKLRHTIQDVGNAGTVGNVGNVGNVDNVNQSREENINLEYEDLHDFDNLSDKNDQDGKTNTFIPVNTGLFEPMYTIDFAHPRKLPNTFTSSQMISRIISYFHTMPSLSQPSLHEDEHDEHRFDTSNLVHEFLENIATEGNGTSYRFERLYPSQILPSPKSSKFTLKMVKSAFLTTYLNYFRAKNPKFELYYRQVFETMSIEEREDNELYRQFLESEMYRKMEIPHEKRQELEKIQVQRHSLMFPNASHTEKRKTKKSKYHSISSPSYTYPVNYSNKDTNSKQTSDETRDEFEYDDIIEYLATKDIHTKKYLDRYIDPAIATTDIFNDYVIYQQKQKMNKMVEYQVLYQEFLDEAESIYASIAADYDIFHKLSNTGSLIPCLLDTLHQQQHHRPQQQQPQQHSNVTNSNIAKCLQNQYEYEFKSKSQKNTTFVVQERVEQDINMFVSYFLSPTKNKNRNDNDNNNININAVRLQLSSENGVLPNTMAEDTEAISRLLHNLSSTLSSQLSHQTMWKYHHFTNLMVSIDLAIQQRTLSSLLSHKSEQYLQYLQHTAKSDGSNDDINNDIDKLTTTTSTSSTKPAKQAKSTPSTDLESNSLLLLENSTPPISIMYNINGQMMKSRFQIKNRQLPPLNTLFVSSYFMFQYNTMKSLQQESLLQLNTTNTNTNTTLQSHKLLHPLEQFVILVITNANLSLDQIPLTFRPQFSLEEVDIYEL